MKPSPCFSAGWLPKRSLLCRKTRREPAVPSEPCPQARWRPTVHSRPGGPGQRPSLCNQAWWLAKAPTKLNSTEKWNASVRQTGEPAPTLHLTRAKRHRRGMLRCQSHEPAHLHEALVVFAQLGHTPRKPSKWCCQSAGRRASAPPHRPRSPRTPGKSRPRTLPGRASPPCRNLAVRTSERTTLCSRPPGNPRPGTRPGRAGPPRRSLAARTSARPSPFAPSW